MGHLSSKTGDFPKSSAETVFFNFSSIADRPRRTREWSDNFLGVTDHPVSLPLRSARPPFFSVQKWPFLGQKNRPLGPRGRIRAQTAQNGPKWQKSDFGFWRFRRVRLPRATEPGCGTGPPGHCGVPGGALRPLPRRIWVLGRFWAAGQAAEGPHKGPFSAQNNGQNGQVGCPGLRQKNT